MGQRYGVLAQVYRAGENYEYVKPPHLAANDINIDTPLSALTSAMNLEQMSEYRKAKASQVNTNIQLYLGWAATTPSSSTSCKKILP